MQQKLSTDNLLFLARLSKSPEGHALLEILRAELAETDARLRRTAGDETLRAQGRAQALDELIADITTAKQKLNPPRPTQPSSLQALRAMG